MNRNLFKGFAVTLIALIAFPPSGAIGASPTVNIKKTDEFSLEYDAPDFTNTQLPSITSCDPKKGTATDTAASLESAGKQLFDVARKELKSSKGETDEDDDGEDDSDIDGKATMDTQCDKAAKFSADGVKDIECAIVTDEFIAGKKASATKSQAALACQRGVLQAVSGEVGCLKQQVVQAEKFLDSLVNQPGGLNTMLTEGGKELQDRRTQLKTVNERIDGGPNQNPPGLAAAKAEMDKLTTAMPAQKQAATDAVNNQRELEARFESLITQTETAKIMECMNTPVGGMRCVKQGSSSKNYPSGDVSPLGLMQCLYAQSANKVVGGSAVTNPEKEKAMYAEAQAKFALKPDVDIRGETTIPMVSDQASFDKSYHTVKYNTPDELLAKLKAEVGSMSGTGKPLLEQLNASFDACKKQVQNWTNRDRANSNSSLRASLKAINSAGDRLKSQNSSEFRKLRAAYGSAIKAATGASYMLNTAPCEKASLEDQANCFQALDSLVDSLLKGTPRSTDKALTGPAAALTNSAPPPTTFTGMIAAKNDPKRSINGDCAGIEGCLTKYTNIAAGLKTYVEELPSNINNSIQSAASNLAAGKDANNGQITNNGVTLASLANNIEAMKGKLGAAMSRMQVKGGLNLDPKKLDAPEIDEKTGLYKPGGLRNLVLQQINPGLPDLSSEGFSKALDSIHDADEKLDKDQEEIGKYLDAIESKQASCAKEKKKAVCERLQKSLDHCRDKEDAVNEMLQSSLPALAVAAGQNKDAKNTGEDAVSKLVNANTGTKCGVQEEEMNKYCPYGDAVTDNLDKDEDEVGSKKKKNGVNSGSAK